MPVKRPMVHTPATLQELGRRMRACAAELEKGAEDMRSAGLDSMVVDHSLSGLRGLTDVEQFARSVAASYYAARETAGVYGMTPGKTIVDINERITYASRKGSSGKKKRS